MTLSNEQILDAVANKTVMEIVDLVKAMEEKFNVSAAAVAFAAPAAGAGGAAAEAVEEQTEFKVTLASFGEKKVDVIKVVRELTGLGLKEAKDLVESAPAAVVKEGISKQDAAEVKKKLEAAGATVEVK